MIQTLQLCRIKLSRLIWRGSNTVHNYDNKPGIFKLVKQNEQWKVTDRGSREKGPF